MTHEPDWMLLDEYLAGTASPERRAAVARWAAEHPERAALLDALQRSVRPAGDADFDVDAAWRRTSTVLKSGERPMSPHVGRAWRIAALVVAAVGIGAVGTSLLSSRLRGDRASSMQDVATLPGQRTTVELGDGARVTLNSGSRLHLAAAADGAREVVLDGEAMFEVRHDPSRRFRVRTATGVVEDIGTRFVVRAYRELQRVDVAVAEGEVELQRPTGSTRAVRVVAGMLGTIAGDGSPLVAPLGSSDRFFSWTRGVLSLDGQPLREVLPLLERRYGVTIRVSDAALAARPVFGTFTTEPVRQTLDALALALGATVQERGGVFTMVPRAR